MFHVEHYPGDKALSAKSKAAGEGARATQEVYPPSPWSSGIINLLRFCPQNMDAKRVAGKMWKGEDLLPVELPSFRLIVKELGTLDFGLCLLASPLRIRGVDDILSTSNTWRVRDRGINPRGEPGRSDPNQNRNASTLVPPTSTNTLLIVAASSILAPACSDPLPRL